MYCSYCGTQVGEGARFCRKCGKPLAGGSSVHPSADQSSSNSPEPPQPPPRILSRDSAEYQSVPLTSASSTASVSADSLGNGPVPSHMFGAIMTTLFCCIPLGILAILQAANVNTCLAAGDRAGAVKASKQAGTFVAWGVASGFIVGLVFLASKCG